MPVEVYVLEDDKRLVSVVIERKLISSCRLKVFPAEGGPFAALPGQPPEQVKFSVPLETSAEWIARYLHSKKDWILQKLDAFKKTGPAEAIGEICGGMSIRMLGEDMVFSPRRAEKPLVYAEYRRIHIAAPELSPPVLAALFEAWWRQQARALYGEILDALYPVIEKHSVKKPRLYIRKMRTLWGSSSPGRNTITLNFYLLQARRPCIEYVVLHELSHFLYPSHSREFYDFLTLYMPDWKERKKILDNDVARGFR